MTTRNNNISKTALIMGTIVAALVTACGAPEPVVREVEVTRLVEGTGDVGITVAPQRVIVAEVRGVRFTTGDLVERIRILQGMNHYQGGQVDFSRITFQLLTDLIHAELLRQAAPGVSIDVTDAQIDKTIRDQFRPEAQPGQEADDTQLDAQFDNNYENFLTQADLTDDAYRRIVEERLQQRDLFARMLASLPGEAPQVEVQAIVLGPDTLVTAEAVHERLVLGQDFGSVAREVTGTDGYVGWVPEGAFPEFDRYLFGETDIGNPALLETGEISHPIHGDESIFIVQPIGEAEIRQIEPAMQFQMASVLVENWKDEQLKRGSEEGWVKINFDSDLYAWVSDQTRPATPLPTKPQATSLSGATEADLWVHITNNFDYGFLEVYADPTFDVDTANLTVLVDGKSFLNSNRIYNDDGPLEMCCSTEERPHNTIKRVSAQTPIGDLKCERNKASDAFETIFACVWRN